MNQKKIAILGLGYVGLPLAVEFGKTRPVLGFDVNEKRIRELASGSDLTKEVETSDLKAAKFLSFTSDLESIADCKIYIVTVPTPIDERKLPDLGPLLKASEMIGGVIKPGDIVIYESTVYPGATEEDCVPVIEKVSGFRYNVDFYVGYSPERINPGDKKHRLPDIQKVTSGSNAEIAEEVDMLYREIITAGTFKASSIKVAEASKVIENVQRDVNIALINELYQIFVRMGIDTNEVIEAAATKWNFMKLKPGLVGGHCISVDPYYLLHRSQTKGYIPDLIRAAREINDGMVEFISNQFVKVLLENKINPIELQVTILGFAFKENCPDVRNTKVYALYLRLIDLGFAVNVYDPIVDAEHVYNEYGIEVLQSANFKSDVGVLAVPHGEVLSAIREGRISFRKNLCYDFRSSMG